MQQQPSMSDRMTQPWLAFLAILLAAGAGPADTSAPPARSKADPALPAIAIAEAEKAPVVDGDLGDPCWAQAEEGRLGTDEYSFPVKLKTTFKLCQKDEVLYLAIWAGYGDKGGQKTGDGAQHDGALWNGENVEIFIDPDNGDTPGYYQLILTPFDVTGDLYNNEPRDPELRWEPQYEVKSRWTTNAWTIEYGIPLGAFNFTKTVYENFGLNINRVSQEIASWAPNHSEGFHFPHKFGEARGLKGKSVTTNEPGLFRSPYLRVNDRVIKAQANPSLIPEKPPALVSGPEVKAAGSSAEIVFEVNTRTDVAVWIEDARGERVRHLAAGMLGTNAPAPLAKNSLKQSVAWDYLDDFGRKVPAGAYKVRVGVGSKAALDKEIGRSEAPRQIMALAADAKGCVYTYEGHLDQWARVRKYDRDGKFVSMLLPPPADVPVEKLKGLNIIDYGPDGQARFGSRVVGQVMPHLDIPYPQTLLINSKGQIIFSGCEYQGGPAHFYKINADGSLPDDFVGPYLKDINWLVYFQTWAKRFHFALDPLDEDTIYISGLKETHRSESAGGEANLELESEPGLWTRADRTLYVRPTNAAAGELVIEAGRWALTNQTAELTKRARQQMELVPERQTFYNAVCRISWGKDAPLETFVGKRNVAGMAGSDKPGEFFDPQGIAFDKDNNLWVCDRRNNRLQVFDRAGKFLWQIPHPAPYEVRISRKTGERYVLGGTNIAYDTKDARYGIVGHLREVTLTKYGPGAKPKALAQTRLAGVWSYWWTMALDDSGAKPQVWLVWAGKVNGTHGIETVETVARVADLGDRFGAPEILIGAAPPPRYYRIAAGWDSDIICAGGHWFDANSERYLGKHDGYGYSEVAAARDGRWVVRFGYGCESVAVYPEAWATNAAIPAITNWQLTPPSLTRAGQRGFDVAPNGDVYAARYYQWSSSSSVRGGMEGPDHHVAIDRYTIDGKLIGKRLVYELSPGACSPAADIKGNIYVCDNFGRRIGQLYEDDIASNMPSWAPDYQIGAVEWDQLRGGKMIGLGYRKFIVNPLIRYVGTIYKFSPRGGGLLWRAGQGEYKQYWPQTNAAGEVLYADWGYPSTPPPKRPATHWSSSWVPTCDGREGMYPAWLEGVEWEFLGASPASGRYSKGHDGCVCFNLRFCVDDFGRTYVPAVHRSTIRMIDTAGNEVLRIGRYGNLDSGPTARLKEPNIPLRYPTGTALSKRYLYVVEEDIPRVLRVKMGYAQEKTADVAVR